MHRRACHLSRGSGAARKECVMSMTAAQASTADGAQPTIVNVGLGSRAYDIVIGRGVLRSLGTRIAALRPGVRTAIVTDRNVAKHWLEATEAALAAAGVPS